VSVTTAGGNNQKTNYLLIFNQLKPETRYHYQ